MNLNPTLNKGKYFFISISENREVAEKPILFFVEQEGRTLILEQSQMERENLTGNGPFGWITLQAVTDLNDIAITAIFSSCLAQEGISCNVVAGFYHDHIFVPYNSAKRAVQILESLHLTDVVYEV